MKLDKHKPEKWRGHFGADGERINPHAHTVTIKEFVTQYADDEEMTVDEVFAAGLRAQPMPVAGGWQMMTRVEAEAEVALGNLPDSVLADWEDQ